MTPDASQLAGRLAAELLFEDRIEVLRAVDRLLGCFSGQAPPAPVMPPPTPRPPPSVPAPATTRVQQAAH